jgi:hypothetical protein
MRVTLVASTAMATICIANPMTAKLTSPYEAIPTPREMVRTIPSSLRENCFVRKMKAARRIATGEKDLRMLQGKGGLVREKAARERIHPEKARRKELANVLDEAN